MYPFDSSGSFRIYLFLSRHYPIISQLFTHFKSSSIPNTDERRKLFQTRIQTILDETSYKCFYYGQLCLPTCLLKLKYLFHSYYKQEKFSSTILTNKSNKKQQPEYSINNFDHNVSNGINNNNSNIKFLRKKK